MDKVTETDMKGLILLLLLFFYDFHCVYVCTCECWDPRRLEASPPGTAVISSCQPSHVWVAGSKFGSSARIAYTLNWWVTSLAPCCWCSLKIRVSLYNHVSLKLRIILTQIPESYDYRHALLYSSDLVSWKYCCSPKLALSKWLFCS